MSLGIEVRKDLLWTFDERGNPIEPRFDQVNRIGDLIANALVQYFTVDRVDMNKNQHVPKFNHHMGDTKSLGLASAETDGVPQVSTKSFTQPSNANHHIGSIPHSGH